jgi:lysozyme
MMNTSPRGIALLKQFEGFKQDAYQDVVGVWTIGYGFTEGVKAGDIMSRDQAEERLREELQDYERTVLRACGDKTPNQNQFDAMVCLAWNIGREGFKTSTVAKAHRRGDFEAAARAFNLWNKAGGKVVRGLVRRRAAEAALYLEPIMDTESMPQRLDGESRFTDSRINKAGIATAGTATIATVAEVTSTVRAIKDDADTLREWAMPIALVIIVVLAGYIVWTRIKMRKDGII